MAEGSACHRASWDVHLAGRHAAEAATSAAIPGRLQPAKRRYWDDQAATAGKRLLLPGFVRLTTSAVGLRPLPLPAWTRAQAAGQLRHHAQPRGCHRVWTRPLSGALVMYPTGVAGDRWTVLATP